MAQEIFERYEKKYLLTEAQYLGLKRVFEDRMAADAYGVHTISNIYFDTKDFELIRIQRKASSAGLWGGERKEYGISGNEEEIQRCGI